MYEIGGGFGLALGFGLVLGFGLALGFCLALGLTGLWGGRLQMRVRRIVRRIPFFGGGWAFVGEGSTSGAGVVRVPAVVNE